jgi:hypothetical protein
MYQALKDPNNSKETKERSSTWSQIWMILTSRSWNWSDWTEKSTNAKIEQGAATSRWKRLFWRDYQKEGTNL